MDWHGAGLFGGAVNDKALMLSRFADALAAYPDLRLGQFMCFLMSKRRQALSDSRVRFSALTPSQLSDYVDTGEPLGKAGAYAVQGRAATFIERISGSYSGIMGLPVFETAALLREVGFKC